MNDDMNNKSEDLMTNAENQAAELDDTTLDAVVGGQNMEGVYTGPPIREINMADEVMVRVIPQV